jgi:hypothetical protein
MSVGGCECVCARAHVFVFVCVRERDSGVISCFQSSLTHANDSR